MQADARSSTTARTAHRRQVRLTTREHRKLLEAALERLLAAVEHVIADLDALDGDPDLEPSLGSRILAPYESQARWSMGARDDREWDCEDEGAQCDDEGANHDAEPTWLPATTGGMLQFWPGVSK